MMMMMTRNRKQQRNKTLWRWEDEWGRKKEREWDQKLEHQTSWGSEAASECGVNGKDNTFNGILLIFSYEKLNWWMGRDEARRTPAKSVNRQRQRWSIEGWNESIVTEIWQHLTFVSGGKLLHPTSNPSNIWLWLFFHRLHSRFSVWIEIERWAESLMRWKTLRHTAQCNTIPRSPRKSNWFVKGEILIKKVSHRCALLSWVSTPPFALLFSENAKCCGRLKRK